MKKRKPAIVNVRLTFKNCDITFKPPFQFLSFKNLMPGGYIPRLEIMERETDVRLLGINHS